MDYNVNNDDFYRAEIIRFLSGELISQEEEALQLWINSCEENSLFFRDCRDLWLISSPLAVDNKEKRKDAWDVIASKISEEGHDQNKIRNLNTFKKYLQIAALLIIAFGAGFIISGIRNNKSATKQLCIITTPLGSRTNIDLPDGTHVCLNAGSKLTYDNLFDIKDRKVTLEGEAFFKVKTNKAKPFIVQTKFMNVKALGTAFNVKAYNNDTKATATLVEGIIQVSNPAKNNKAFLYTLKPNQNLSISGSESSDENTNLERANPAQNISKTDIAPSKIEFSENINTELYTSWKDKRWVIDGQNLEELATLFERRFNVRIHIQSENLKRYRFSGTIENETLEQVLEILQLTAPLKYTIGKGEVWWKLDDKLHDSYINILKH